MYKRIGSFIKKLLTKRLTVVLFCVSGALLIAAVITGLIIFREGQVANNNAQELLEAYKQNMHQSAVSSAMPTTGQAPQESAVPTPNPTQNPVPTTYEGYEVLGVLSIEGLDLELPIISETSREALKVSCCYYQGPIPGEAGNVVITGHNYADGSIFGRLDLLETGDEVIIYTLFHTYTYYVYEVEVIKPDDTDALDEYKGDMALTLMTCTSHGNRRLIARCCISSD